MQPPYGTINTTVPKEGKMPTDTLQDLEENTRLHAADPILEKKSDLFGWVKIYPPVAPSSEWKDHSWLLTTEYDTTKNPPGLSVRIKAKYVGEVFERPHFIYVHHKFGEPDLSIEQVESPKPTKIEIPDRTVVQKDFTFED